MPLRLAVIAWSLIASTGVVLAQSSDMPTRPIEVLVIARDDAPRCEPRELRVPAEANIDLRIQNQGRRSVEIRAPELFRPGTIRGVTGAAEGQTKGSYVVDPAQNAQMIVLTPARGQYRFVCADRGAPDPETTGTLTAVR